MMTRGCCWPLIMWQFVFERENSKVSVSRDPSRSCEAFYDLAVKVPKYHFCHILLVKQVTKASLDSKRG